MTQPDNGFSAAGVLLVLRLPIPRRIKLKLATEDALAEVQQFIEEGTGEAWPPGAQEHPGKPAARVHVAVKRGQIHARFGDADAPILTLAPINITDLLPPGRRHRPKERGRWN